MFPSFSLSRLTPFRTYDSQSIFAISEFLLFFGGLQLESPMVWQWVAPAIAVLATFAWVSALRRVRAVSDTPTSRIASAAQGYVELRGAGKPLDGLPILARLTQTQCLWYRYRIEQRRDNKWDTVEQGQSDASFLINDGSGEALVDPDGAELLPERRKTWTEGSQRFTEWLILEGDSIYVLGGFRTHSGDQMNLNLAEDVRQLLAEWKQDRPRLLQRFDLNSNGEIDLWEWELARAQARREVEQNHEALRAQPALNLVGMPEGGRLYLISTLQTEAIVRRYGYWAVAQLLIFFAALVGFAFAGRQF